MSIVIFGDLFSFPEGNAATNRVHTYAKGLMENGISVHVICFNNEYLEANTGVTKGIYYYYPFNQKKRSPYFIVRRWHKFKKYLKTAQLFRKINQDDKTIAVICYTKLLPTQVFAFIISKFIKSKMVSEQNEYPLQWYQKNFFKKNVGRIKVYMEAKLCTGINCISQYLVDFYKKRGVSDKRMLLIPSTVDTERFKVLQKPLLPFQYIAYCGSLTLSKDGVNILVESFASISNKYPDINLLLIGKGDTIEDEIAIKELVDKMNLKERVIFLGQLSREKVPGYLINARILALARPKTMVADAGFPSKLTEYLATGVPLVVTEVGEIPLYLTDNENAFISQPDSIVSFATKLDFVLSNYEFAKNVAAKGKKLTDTTFNYNFQATRMLSFIESL